MCTNRLVDLVKKAALQTEDKKSMPDELVNHKPVGGISAATILISTALVGEACSDEGEKTLLPIKDVGKEAYRRFAWVAKGRGSQLKIEEPPQINTGDDDSSNEIDGD
jgi:hypothetical protein